jgi:TRAP-type C4-dicarboxylate transport system permease small subunit
LIANANRALALLRQTEALLLGALLLAMSLLYTVNVLVRDLAPAYASRFAWIDELCLFGLVWVVFLGLGITLERGRHIGMTALLQGLAPRRRRGITLVIDLTGLALCLYVAQVCLTVTLLVLRSGQASPTLGISMSWLYGPMPVGFALLGLRYGLELFGASDRHKVHVDPMLQL